MVTHDNRREATGLYLATIEVVTSLAERAEVIAALADRRVALVREDDAPGAKERARQLRDHVRAYVIPRARALESPLLVVLLGPTGAGKSTLMNTLARATVSRTGVLRPTTREAVLLATDADAATLRKGALAGIGGGQIVRAPATTASAGLAIVDAPDLDSVERANRVIADALVEAADLGIFVTSAMRYADKVADDVERAAAEGEALRAITAKSYDAELAALLEELRGGTFLRTEVLRHWESYVKADQITRFFSRGLGRIRGTIVAVFRGMPEAPVGVVEKEVTSDVIAVAVARATEAARRVASEWSSREGPAAQL